MYQEVSDVERRLSELQTQLDRLSLSLHLWFEKQEQLPRDDDARRLLESDLSSASALSGFERTDARLAALEASVHRALTELSGQMQSVVAEVRASRTGSLPAASAEAAAWPLDDVVKLHSQLRGAGDVSTLPQRAAPATPPAPAGGEPQRLLPEAPAALIGRMEALERDLAGEQTRIRERAERSLSSSRLWRVAIVALIVAVAGTGAVVVNGLRDQLSGAEARVAEAETLAAATAQTAAAQIAAAREEVDREVAEANAAALQAQTVSDLLAAPDLVRYSLVGPDGGPARGQTMFSRSRGLVFTGSRLPAPPPGSTYQIWLLTPTSAHSTGMFTPDTAGRYTLATDEPPTAPAPIVGVSVTVEPAQGSQQPTGPAILARVPPAE